MTASWRLRCVLSSVGLVSVTANSKHLASLCRGHTCNDPHFPILDYSAADGTCICNAHPCWDDHGSVHTCDSPEHPYLSFVYDDARELHCECWRAPWYGSTYISRDLCPGHDCEDPATPVLDWDEEEQSCFCRSHPCNDGGVQHSCEDGGFPILRYLEYEATNKGEEALPLCECLPRLEQPEQPRQEL